MVTITPIPDDGWHFAKWTDDMAGNSTPAQIIIHCDTTITAVIILKAFQNTVKAQTGKVIANAQRSYG